MGLVSITLPSDGTTADVADVNTPFTAIVTALNGNIDNSNISGVSGSKITAGTIPGTALDTNTQGGWIRGVLPAVSSVTANGNRSYNVTFASTVASYLTPGMRVRSTRTVAAPTQCTSLNGTTQYYSKTSPAGMTFTDDFVVSAWVKLPSYATADIASRFNGTSGWEFLINSSGQIRMNGYNAAGANFSSVLSYQSIPLNKWVHVTAQLDMSAFTATTTTSYIMIDGLDVPASVTRGGTNPTALVQAGNLEIGSVNSGTSPFPGKIAQVAIYSAKVTQATILASMHQTLAGTETSLISAYSFNGVITDLNANANNLTANGSAVATSADSPYSLDATGTPSATLDFGIVQKVATTVVTIQVPEGNTIPTTGGVSSVDFAPSGVPYGFPKQRGKWVISGTYKADLTQSSPVNGTWYNVGAQINVPVGEWVGEYTACIRTQASSVSFLNGWGTISTTNNSSSDTEFDTLGATQGSNNTDVFSLVSRRKPVSVATQAPYYFNVRATSAGVTSLIIANSQFPATVTFENAYL